MSDTFGEETPMIGTGTTQPETISLSDILLSAELIQQQETTDRATLNSILSLSIQSIKPKLVQWALLGFPYGYPIYEVTLVKPVVCSDGVQRDFMGYVEYLLGTTLLAHVSLLQPKFTDIEVRYALFGSTIKIVVIKP